MKGSIPLRGTFATRLSSRFPRKSFILIALLGIAGLTAAWAVGSSAESIRAALFSRAADAFAQSERAEEHPPESFEPPSSLANGALETARSRHTATILADGRVLVAGGDSGGSSELYDGATGISSPSGFMAAARSGHTASRLANGRVLVAGGSAGGSAVASTEIFDPASGTFSAGPDMGTARSGHTATTLSNGDILIAGGGSGSAEIFDGTSFTNIAAAMTASRANASAIRMNDGRIFISGGDGLTSAEIFNPADGSFTAAGNAMTVERVRALLRLLPDGKIQIIGGGSDGSMEVYDPSIDTIGAYAHVVPVSDPCANLINHVLRAETRAALIHSGASAPERDRSGHTITELGDSAVVIGGTSSGGAALDSITVFSSSTATLTTDKLDYQPGQTVHLAGTGYAAGETVRVMIHEDPHTPQERGFDAVADENGSFTGTYLVQDYDLNMHFVVGARGMTSGKTAQTTFTDARNWDLIFAGTGTGSVTITPSAGTINAPVPCGGTGTNAASQTVTSTCAPNITTSENEAIVTFSVSPTAGSSFGGWSSPANASSSTCIGTTSPCSLIWGGGGNGEITVTFNANTSTTTAVASSANPSVFGQLVTFTATVSRSPLSGSPSPTGSVQFIVDGSNFGAPVALISGGPTTATAATSTSALSVGSHTVSATYIPTGGFNASSGSLTPNQVVNKANTTTTISSDHLNPLAWSQIFPSGAGPSSTTCGQTSHPDGAGRLIVYARTVCGGGVGEVWVQNNANGLGGSPTWALVASGGPARHGQTTVYDQVSNRLILFGGCSGGCTPVNNDVWVLTNANGQGGAAVWTQITGIAGGPPAARNHAAGAYDPATNRLMIYGGQNGSGVVVGATFSDVWVLTNANTAAGAHTWTSLATSGTFPTGVYQARAFYDSANNRLTVAGGARSDTGTASSAVNVLTNANGIGGSPAWTNLIAEGAAGAPAFAGWNTTQNTAANRGILAQQSTSNLYYLNNVNGLGGSTSYTLITPSGGGGGTPGYGLGYDASSGRTMAWHLNGATNTSFVLLQNSSSTYGESVTFTATVAVNAPGAGTPGGTVQFFAGATPIGGPQPVVSGSASVVTSTLVVGTHNITAVYSGDPNFNGSTSGILVHTVSQAATTTTVIASPNPSVYGDSVTFTSTTLSGGSPVGEGTVAFYDGGSCATPGMLLSGPAAVQSLTGDAGFSSSTLTAGSHTVIACYSGTNFGSSNGSVVHIVNKRSLTVTADDKTITYGDADPAFTFTYGIEFVLGDDAGDIDVAPTCTVAGPHTNVGTHPIACSGGSDDNYQFNFVNGTLQITPATLNVNAVANTKIYGDLDPTFAYALTGFKFSENAISAGVTGTAGCSRTPGETVAGSPYTITCAPGTLAAANYVFATGTTAAFTVTPATLNVNAVANTKIYGDGDPTFGYTLSGFKFSEDATTAGVSGAATCSRAPGESVAGGPYAITCAPGTLAAANYIFATGNTANFTITAATLSVNAVANTKIYGDLDPTFAYTLTGYKFSEDATTAGVTGAASCTRTAGEVVAGSPYTITCAAGTLAAANYIFATGATANFTITPATLSVSAVSNTKVYGDTDPAFAYALAGFKFGEDATTAFVTGAASCIRTAGESVAGSPYTITCTPGSLAAPNYVFATGATASFTITPATLNVNAVANTKVYGDGDPLFSHTIAGYKLSEDATSAGVTGVASCTRTLGETVAGSPYTITCAPGSLAAANYIFATGTTANFTITASTLSVNAVADTKVYGESDPVFAYTLSGFKFTDDATSAGVTGAASCTRTPGQSVAGSPYTITCAPGSLAAANYIFATGTTANFTITPATLTVNAVVNSKTYGDLDPAFAYSLNGFKFSEDETSAGVSGLASCTRTTGESVAGSPYTITCSAGTLAAANYVFVTGATANFTIDKRVAAWTTNPASKTYGDADPMPLTTGSGANFVAADNVTATYSRVAGENASPPTYHITATLSATGDLNNYIITNDGAEFTINKRLATWTTNAASKTYGDSDPAGLTTGSGTNFVATDNVTATYSRVSGENASPPTYHITATLNATPLSALDNYIITNAGAEFTINKRLATWTTNDNFKTYGDTDPAPVTTGAGGNFLTTDNVTATYSRVAGEDASPPTYHISATLSASPLSALDNYIITNTGAEFTIFKRAATWTTNPNSKTYGDADPLPLTTGSGSNFVPADDISATYSRALGESASPPTYHITATLADPHGKLVNYILTNDGAEFTINKRVATWTTNPASKTYGDLDPSPLTSGSGSNFIAADNVTATYSRVAGENASPPTYHITATLATTGDLNNYIITNDGAEFTINKRVATWTTNPASKTYGDADPMPLTSGTGSNFVAADNVMATYSRVAGENATPPTYHITATLSATPLSALDNYIITNDGAEFAINKRLATWTTDPNSKTYGDLDPAGVTTGSGTNFVAADNVIATYSRVAGENASPPTYHITATLSATGDLNNYIITNDGAEFTINKRVATWTTNPASKTYGDADPAPLTSGSGSNFVAADNVTATYTRVAGQNATPPTYHITATLSATPLSALDNYAITNNGAEFTINKRTVTVTADPKTKVYGDADPARTYQITIGSLAFSDAFSGALDRIAGENVGTYAINQGTLALGGNYILNYVPAALVITTRPITVTADAKTKVFSTMDPPLTYQITSGSLAFSDPFIGALTRDPGELVGNYAILRGTLNINDGNGGNNYAFTYVGSYLTIVTGCSVFDGFRSPIGGAVELGTGGSFNSPVRTFKLGSTIPVKWGATCFNTVLITGVHTLQMIKYSSTTTVVGDPIDATPTDAATTGNQFRLTGTEWHYNLDTKKTQGLSEGTWLVRATLYDGSAYTVWISIKK